MKAEAYKAELLVAFDSTGRIITSKYHTKDDSISLSNRLIWVTTDAEGEHANLQKYDTPLEAEANYHLKRGSAMSNDDVKAILTIIVNGASVGMDNEYWARPIEEVEPQEQGE